MRQRVSPLLRRFTGAIHVPCFQQSSGRADSSIIRRCYGKRIDHLLIVNAGANHHKEAVSRGSGTNKVQGVTITPEAIFADEGFCAC